MLFQPAFFSLVVTILDHKPICCNRVHSRGGECVCTIFGCREHAQLCVGLFSAWTADMPWKATQFSTGYKLPSTPSVQWKTLHGSQFCYPGLRTIGDPQTFFKASVGNCSCNCLKLWEKGGGWIGPYWAGPVCLYQPFTNLRWLKEGRCGCPTATYILYRQILQLFKFNRKLLMHLIEIILAIA